MASSKVFKASDGDDHVETLVMLLSYSARGVHSARLVREIDFAHDSRTTIWRRALRRMGLHGLHSMQEYIGLVRDWPAEIDALSHDILINVMCVFVKLDVMRDPPFGGWT